MLFFETKILFKVLKLGVSFVYFKNTFTVLRASYMIQHFYAALYRLRFEYFSYEFCPGGSRSVQRKNTVDYITEVGIANPFEIRANIQTHHAKK